MAKQRLGFHAGYRIVSIALTKVAEGELIGERRLDQYVSTDDRRRAFVRALQQQLKKHGVSYAPEFESVKSETLNKFATMVGSLPGKSGTPDPD